jgi:hypothetical protein
MSRSAKELAGLVTLLSQLILFEIVAAGRSLD